MGLGTLRLMSLYLTLCKPSSVNDEHKFTIEQTLRKAATELLQHNYGHEYIEIIITHRKYYYNLASLLVG